jgi:4-cresol dehydrogenase (hydroxylating)
MVSVITISYDKENSEETRRAAQCYEAFFEAIMKTGYVPYRTSIYSMDKLAMGSEVFWDVMNEIKLALDPHQIISKGRYQPIADE